jgi:predicted permease
MSIWRQFHRGLRALVNRRAADRDIADEVESYLDQATAAGVERGFSYEEARRAAKVELGGAVAVREQVRSSGWENAIATPLRDLRYALRQMRRSPGFTATAVFTLALGITGNAVVFGVLEGLILRPVDVPHGDRVMTLTHPGNRYPGFSYPEVRDVRDGNTVFSAVAGYATQSFGLEFNGVAQAVWGCEVDGRYFEVVAIKPFLGRLLQRADDVHAGASQAAVLSWPAWKSDFGADPNIVGKVVRINKHPYTIVGVTPEGFYGTEKIAQPDIFVPLANEASLDGVDWMESRSYGQVWSIVRLRDGVTIPQVQAELNTLAARIRRQYPRDEEKLALTVARPGLIGDFMGAPARAFLAGVMGLAAIVLLAACANLGSLFAARTADRGREIAIRLAIGSSRGRIVRQILTEAVAMAVLGGACACPLAWAAIAGLANWRPPTEYPMRFQIPPRPSLLVMAFLISVLAGLVFGVMPLWQIFKTDPNEVIKSGGNRSFAGRRWALRDILLAAQIALCCVAVTAAFVSLRGLNRALTVDIGFNPKHAVVTVFQLGQAGYSAETADHFQRQLLDRVKHLPGVKAAGYTETTPLSLDSPSLQVFSQQAIDFRSSSKAFSAYEYDVSPGYLSAAETPLVAGRDVSFADTRNTPAVAIVNREFARRLFHAAGAVGRYFKNSSGQPIEIVGVVADGKYLTLTEDPAPAVFFPVSQRGTTKTLLVVRTDSNTSDAITNSLAATVRKVIRDLDAAVPIRESSAWTSQLALSFFPAQVATVALGLFGAFGLLLSIAGTFGLASYTVSKRLRELSIRVAMGARAKQVLAAALGRMLILLASGSLVGIVLGVAASRVLSAIVYQASAQDPLVLVAVVTTTLLTGSLSVAGPVRRALRIDPASVLREQ